MGFFGPMSGPQAVRPGEAIDQEAEGQSMHAVVTEFDANAQDEAFDGAASAEV